MHNQNIGVGVHYIALHLQPYYKNKYGYKFGDFINAEKISKSTVSTVVIKTYTVRTKSYYRICKNDIDKHSK